MTLRRTVLSRQSKYSATLKCIYINHAIKHHMYNMYNAPVSVISCFHRHIHNTDRVSYLQLLTTPLPEAWARASSAKATLRVAPDSPLLCSSHKFLQHLAVADIRARHSRRKAGQRVVGSGQVALNLLACRGGGSLTSHQSLRDDSYGALGPGDGALGGLDARGGRGVTIDLLSANGLQHLS